MASDKIPFRASPMLATLVGEPFRREGWVFEEKYDGYRLLAYKEGGRVTLLSRNGNDKTAAFAAVAKAVAELKSQTLLLDGEAVAFDEKQISRFQFLQRGAHTQSFAAFDCLYLNGRDLRGDSLRSRRAAMELAVEGGRLVFPSRILAADGLKAFATARRRGLEGMIGKDSDSLYVEGRSKHWLKCKVHREEEFVIGGYTAPAGSRLHFGALLLGAYEGEKLIYVGKVGTGFTASLLQSLLNAFRPLVRGKSAFADPVRERDVTFLSPELVAQVAFQEWTADRKLRQPVFLGLRDDKSPRECVIS